MISPQDQIHLKELVHIYYPCDISPVESTFNSEPFLPSLVVEPPPETKATDDSLLTSPDSSRAKRSETKPSVSKKFRCCHKKFDTYILSVDHWIKNHHTPAIIKSETLTTTQHGTLPRVKITYDSACQNFSDLGSSEYSLFERASYFLRNIKCCPSNFGLFRPYPKIKDPRQIPNPYSAALAVAYDFIRIVYNPTKEYHYFLSCLLQQKNSDSYPGGLRDHLPYWYFWFNYFYPDYSKTKYDHESYPGTIIQYMDTGILTNIPVEKSKRKLLSHIENLQRKKGILTSSALRKSSQGSNGPRPRKRLFTCEIPGCNKTYKQLSGLRYHKSQGKCCSVPQENEQDLPFRCTFFPCCSSYSTMTGLKYHIRRHHLKPASATTAAKKPVVIDPPPKILCPLGKHCYISFSNTEKLRRHILLRHLPPKSEK